MSRSFSSSACCLVQPVIGTLPPAKPGHVPSFHICLPPPSPLACQDRSWQGGVCKHESWHLFICSLAPTSYKHLRVTLPREMGGCWLFSQSCRERGETECWNTDRVIKTGTFLRVCSHTLISKSEDRDCRTSDKRASEVAQMLLGPFTLSLQPRGLGPQAGDKPPGAHRQARSRPVQTHCWPITAPLPVEASVSPSVPGVVTAKPKDHLHLGAHYPPSTQF